MARYNDDQQEIDNMSVMNGTFSRVNSDLSSNVSSLRTAISTLSQQVVSLSRSAGSMAKSVAEAGDLKVDKKGFAGRLAGQLGGPLGVVLSNAIIDAGIGERISDSLKNGLAGIMSKFKGRGNYSDGGFLNPASMSSISSRSTGIVIKEIQHGITQPLVTANKIHTDQLLETKSGNRAIISALNSIEDAIDGKDNRVTGKRRSDYGKTHSHSSIHSGSVVNNYYSNNSSGSSFDTSSIVEAIGNLNSRFDELADPNSSGLMSGLFSKMPGFLGTAANLAWSIGTFRLTKAFQGKYANDIIRDKNPLITIASAALKQYEWTRLYGELTKEQLNELIRLGGGNQKKIVGRNGWLKDWLLNDPEGFKKRKEELAEKGGLGWLASKLLGGYQWFGQWDEEQWGNEVYTQAERLKKSGTPFSGLFGGPFSAWKFYNADDGTIYKTAQDRKDLELDRRDLYNWNWNEKQARNDKKGRDYQKRKQARSGGNEVYTQAPDNAVPVVIAGAGIVPGWLRALLVKTGLSARYTRDPISASLALQTKQAGYLDSIQEATEVTKTATETESRIDGGKTIQEKQLDAFEEIAKNHKESWQYTKDFYGRLGKGILGTGKGTLLGSLGLVGTVGSMALGLLGFTIKAGGVIAATYGTYKILKKIAKILGLGEEDENGNELPNYANQHTATTLGTAGGLTIGSLQALSHIPGIGKLFKLGNYGIAKPVASVSHAIDATNRLSEGQLGRGVTQGINTVLDWIPGYGWVASSINSAGVIAGDYVEKFTGSQQAGDATSRIVTSQISPLATQYATAAVDKSLRTVGSKAYTGVGEYLAKKGSQYVWDEGIKGSIGRKALEKGGSYILKGSELAKGSSQYALKAAKYGGKALGVGINAALYGTEATSRYLEGDYTGAVISSGAAVIGNVPIIGVLISELALGINDVIKFNIAKEKTSNLSTLNQAKNDIDYLKYAGIYISGILHDNNISVEEKAEKISKNYKSWLSKKGLMSFDLRAEAATKDENFQKVYQTSINALNQNIDSLNLPDNVKNDLKKSGITELHKQYQEEQSKQFNVETLAKKAAKDKNFLDKFKQKHFVLNTYDKDAEPILGGVLGYMVKHNDPNSELFKLQESLRNKSITLAEYKVKLANLYQREGGSVSVFDTKQNQDNPWKIEEPAFKIDPITGMTAPSWQVDMMQEANEKANLEAAAKLQQNEVIKKAKEEEEKARKEYLERLGSASDPIVTSVYTSGDKTTEAIHELTATSERYMKEVQINQQELAKLHTKMYGKGGESVAQAVNDSAKKMSNAVVSSSRYSTQQIVNNSNKTIVAGNQGNDNWFVPMRSTDKTFLTV